MENNDKTMKINHIIRLIIATIIILIIGLILSYIGFYNKNSHNVTYREISDINYRVFLKQNNFFEQEYLPENMTYITSLIDYINIDFAYSIETSENIEGYYNYYIKGIIEANPENSNSKYYTKEYILSDTTTKRYDNIQDIKISESIDVNYQTYNELLTDFKKEYGITMDGNLRIVLVIENIVTNDKEESVTRNNELELNIPLTTLTVEVPISTNNKITEGVLLSQKVDNTGILYDISRGGAFLIYGVASTIIVYLCCILYNSFKQESAYQRKLNKILKTYDSIIVNLKKVPVVNGKNLLQVSSFEELIDAHSEVRNPINYINDQGGAIFLLVSDDYIYYYNLERALFKANLKSDE